MLNRLSLFSLMLGVLFVLSISSCSKPTNDIQAEKLIVGTWEADSPSDPPSQQEDIYTFTSDGKLCVGKTALDSCYNYIITKDNIIVSPQVLNGKSLSGPLFIDSSTQQIYLIVKLTKKDLVIRDNGSERLYHKR